MTTRKVEVTKAAHSGDDVLIVSGTVDGVETQARGWVSAMEHHYNAADYEDVSTEDAKKRGKQDKVAPGRHLKKGATARAMTDAERLAYMEGLLLAAAPGHMEIPIPGRR